MTDLSRRFFLQGALAAGGVLALSISGCGTGLPARIAHADKTGELTANMYVTVLANGHISLAVHKCEMGQGIASGYSTLVAEELSVPIEHVEIHFADSAPEYRTNSNLQLTGGSLSMKEGFTPLRKAAAAAREMLVGAAAASWKVSPRECTVDAGVVHHKSSGRSAHYGDLTRAAARREVPANPTLKPASAFSVIGKANKRVDLRIKVDGSAIFGIDVDVPGMVHALVLHGPTFGAKPVRIDALRARAMRGVIDVFGFEHGVAIVATKYYQALAAARHVEVQWDDGVTHGLSSAELAAAMRDTRETGTANRDDGNASKAIARAATKLEALYEAPYLAHATLEPQNSTVSVTGDSAEVWSPTQSPTMVQVSVAHALDIPEGNVLVHSTLCGGGFGRRNVADVDAQAALIARRVKKPVKLIWSRESDMTQGYYRPIFAIKMAGGIARDGGVSLRANSISQSISTSLPDSLGAAMAGVPAVLRRKFVDALLAMFSTGSIGDLFSTEGLKETPYTLSNIEVRATPVETKVPVWPWRSVGNSVTAFAAESFVDELAHAAHQDPLAFRRQLIKPGSREARVLDAVVKLAGWGASVPNGIGRGLARHFAFGTEVAQVADVELVDGRIRVRRVFCAVHCGLAVNPDIVRAQMEGAIIFGLSAALDQEIVIEKGVVQQRNYDTFPLLRMHEAPEIVVQILDGNEHPSGVGEPGLPPIAPAVANGLFALTGVRLRRMPLQKAWNERGHA